MRLENPIQIRTYAVCRKKFDQAIVQQAMDEGAELWLNSKPTDTTNFEDSIITELLVDGKITEVKSKLLVGADGAHSWSKKTT